MAASTSTLPSAQRLALTCLKAAVGFWFVVTIAGQLLFAFTVASFYGLTAARGQISSWNRTMTHGYVAGDATGNLVVVVHLISAVIIILSGAIQIAPLSRNRAPAFHRWNGRLYMVTAFSVSLAGVYMMLVRGTVGGFVHHLGQGIDALLIMLCAVMAARYAIAGEYSTHRRWALRLYLVVSASLFIRAGLFLSNFGLEQDMVTAVMSYAQYLVPLAVLEIYLRVKDRGGAPSRFAMAAGLSALTLVLAAGISVVTVSAWVPEIKRAFDSCQSIAGALSVTIASAGIDDATRQYRELKAMSSSAYNMDESELNTLGYQLIRAGQLPEAIRVFQLNVEAFPQSSNPYDSLGEAYMDSGDTPRAVANYAESLRLNPKNRNAVKMLQKLGAPSR